MLVEETGCALPLLQKRVASSQLLWRHGLERWVWPAQLVALFVMGYTIGELQREMIWMELAMLGNENSLSLHFAVSVSWFPYSKQAYQVS